MMRTMRRIVVRLLCGALIMSLGAALLPGWHVNAQQAVNLLENPSFEGDYEVRCSFPGGKPWIAVPCEGPVPSRPWQSVMMAQGWSAWWQPPNEDPTAKDFYTTYPNYCGQLAPHDCVAWHMPEYRDTRSALQDPPRIRSGENSQKYFTFWSVHQGGVYQVVEGVRPGMTLRFSVYMHAWSATKVNSLEPNPHFSFGQTGMHMKIGIDPTGGTDPWSKDVIWSPEKDVYDKFERYDVQAIARSTKVTVFTHSRPENPMKHNDIYLDDAELIVVAGGGASSPVVVNPPPAMVAVEGKPAASNGGRISHIVKPGDTLFALALQYSVPVDEIMALNGLKPDSRIELGRELIIALPAPKPPAPAASTSGNPFVSTGNPGSGRGTICVQTFMDNDVNGLRLVGELPLAVSGLHFSVLNSQEEIVADRVLDTTGETCFPDLPATTYRVMAEPPTGYLATQQHRWSISLPSDAVVAVQFGVQLDPTAQNRFPIELVAIPAGLLLGGAVIGTASWLRRRRRDAWM